MNQALSILARDTGELAANYQDAVKGVLTVSRPAATPPTASATIKGVEVMRMIRKWRCLMLESGTAGEARYVNRLFRLAA